MPRNSLAKRAGGRRAAGASSRRFVRARAMVIASHHANVACGATRLPWLPVRSSSSPRARWNRLEQAEQAAPPAARRGAERDRGIAFVRAAAPRAVNERRCVNDEKGQINCSWKMVVCQKNQGPQVNAPALRRLCAALHFGAWGMAPGALMGASRA